MPSYESRPTKAERREAARARARALRAEQERRAQRRKVTRRALIAGGALVLVGGTTAGTLLVIDQRKKEKERRELRESQGLSLPRHVVQDGSWSVGAEGVGTVNEGARELRIVFDYACHFCANLDVAHAEEFSTLVAEKRITLVFQPAKILGQAWTDWCMTAVGLALDNEPDKVLAVHNALLEALARIYQTKDTTDYTLDGVVSVAKSAGLSASLANRIETEVNRETYRDWLEAGNKTFRSYNLDSTPKAFLDGKELKLDNSFFTNTQAFTEVLGGGAGGASPTPGQASSTPGQASPGPTDGASGTGTPSQAPGDGGS
ncbi:thioredoxin domain-containing protein [uncultured Actinomyces sp.]|uniref:DsbA family protein n=1 Tax=uncultured Actinomyces sp. TaxID=249061 RepID=UPI0028E683BD|nr:thioredoxin domain-containing protein [uncultured Actinomyces sp.]